jgi:hypothetical protein
VTSRLDWDYGICAYSEFSDGVLGVGVDLMGSSEQSGRTLDPAQPLGLLSRPLDPDVDPATKEPINGAGALYSFSGSEGVVMPTTDPRLTAKIPQINKGSTVLYSAQSFLHLDGSPDAATVLYQPVGASKGQAISMTGKEGEEVIQIRHVSGSGLALMADGSVVANDKSGKACIILNAEGLVLNGNVKLNGGVVLGDLAAAQPLPLGVPYAAAMGAISAALAAIGTALTGLGAGGAAGAISTATGACGAAAAAVTVMTKAT